MSDFLTRQAARVLAPGGGVRPRVNARFEPLIHGAATLAVHRDETIEASGTPAAADKLGPPLVPRSPDGGRVSTHPAMPDRARSDPAAQTPALPVAHGAGNRPPPAGGPTVTVEPAATPRPVGSVEASSASIATAAEPRSPHLGDDGRSRVAAAHAADPDTTADAMKQHQHPDTHQPASAPRSAVTSEQLPAASAASPPAPGSSQPVPSMPRPAGNSPAAGRIEAADVHMTPSELPSKPGNPGVFAHAAASLARSTAGPDADSSRVPGVDQARRPGPDDHRPAEAVPMSAPVFRRRRDTGPDRAVHISVGTVEVRTSRPTPPPPAPPREHVQGPTPMSLSDYLVRRRGGEWR